MKRNKPRTFLNLSSDRMLGTIGLAKRRDPVRDVWLPFMALFAAGAVIGASAAVLLTPKSGATLRRDLSQGARGVRRKLTNGVGSTARPALTAEQSAQPAQS